MCVSSQIMVSPFCPTFAGVPCFILSLRRWVKGSSIGVLFPVLIALLAPLRMLLVKTPLFDDADMAVLDSEG